MPEQPKCEESPNGSKRWYLNGLRHRVDGPAVVYLDGFKSWWLCGQPHRADGPAIEWIDGSKSWYLNGRELTEEQHLRATVLDRMAEA